MENKGTSSVGCQESETKVRGHPSGNEEWKNISLREFDGPLSHEEGRTCNTLPEVQTGELCSEATTIKDEEGYKAVIHRARCFNVSHGSRKRLWTLSQSFRGMVGETSDAIPTYTQVQMTEAPRMLRLVTHWNQAGDKMFAKIDQLSNPKLQTIRSCVKTE